MIRELFSRQSWTNWPACVGFFLFASVFAFAAWRAFRANGPGAARQKELPFHE